MICSKWDRREETGLYTVNVNEGLLWQHVITYDGSLISSFAMMTCHGDRAIWGSLRVLSSAAVVE